MREQQEIQQLQHEFTKLELDVILSADSQSIDFSIQLKILGVNNSLLVISGEKLHVLAIEITVKEPTKLVLVHGSMIVKLTRQMEFSIILDEVINGEKEIGRVFITI